MRGFHILHYLSTGVWAIDPVYATKMLAVLDRWMSGDRLSPIQLEQFREEHSAAKTPPGVSAKALGESVGILPVYGLLAPKAALVEDVSGPAATPVDQLMSRFKSLRDNKDVGAIVLDMATPGGNAQMVQEFSDMIYETRKVKPVFAIANPEALSGGYWIASAASYFAISPSAEAGSIGVYTMHMDRSKEAELHGVKPTFISYGENKVEGHPFAPLGEQTVAHIQSEVDAFGRAFDSAVARNMGVAEQVVRDQFGQGRSYNSKEALKRGMVSGIHTFDEVLEMAKKAASTKRGNPQGNGRSASTARAQLDLLGRS